MLYGQVVGLAGRSQDIVVKGDDVTVPVRNAPRRRGGQGHGIAGRHG